MCVTNSVKEMASVLATRGIMVMLRRVALSLSTTMKMMTLHFGARAVVLPLHTAGVVTVTRSDPHSDLPG